MISQLEAWGGPEYVPPTLKELLEMDEDIFKQVLTDVERLQYYYDSKPYKYLGILPWLRDTQSPETVEEYKSLIDRRKWFTPRPSLRSLISSSLMISTLSAIDKLLSVGDSPELETVVSLCQSGSPENKKMILETIRKTMSYPDITPDQYDALYSAYKYLEKTYPIDTVRLAARERGLYMD